MVGPARTASVSTGPPDTLVSGAAVALDASADIRPFHLRLEVSIFARMVKSPAKSPPQPAEIAEPSARPADRVRRRRRAAAAQGPFRSAAGRAHRRPAQGNRRRLGRADRPRGSAGRALAIPLEGEAGKPSKPKKIPERSAEPTGTRARHLDGRCGDGARARPTAGLNPVAGLDIALEDAEQINSWASPRPWRRCRR